ncbi:hypothetical protein BJ508DRAFT_332354 [Ascobolus immersus RN42]|uniref:Uncharacterized protein n=1 Tax=Ascobolus immersus RN42 TaxID=1160509 RepID=A0A3N4HMV1_ASCIM|nr:hypothetical protein BJ508DRAFT_332354 [Ascobolus immersus RN42]
MGTTSSPGDSPSGDPPSDIHDQIMASVPYKPIPTGTKKGSSNTSSTKNVSHGLPIGSINYSARMKALVEKAKATEYITNHNQTVEGLMYVSPTEHTKGIMVPVNGKPPANISFDASIQLTATSRSREPDQTTDSFGAPSIPNDIALTWNKDNICITWSQCTSSAATDTRTPRSESEALTDEQSHPQKRVRFTQPSSDGSMADQLCDRSNAMPSYSHFASQEIPYEDRRPVQHDQESVPSGLGFGPGITFKEPVDMYEQLKAPFEEESILELSVDWDVSRIEEEFTKQAKVNPTRWATYDKCLPIAFNLPNRSVTPTEDDSQATQTQRASQVALASQLPLSGFCKQFARHEGVLLAIYDSRRPASRSQPNPKQPIPGLDVVLSLYPDDCLESPSDDNPFRLGIVVMDLPTEGEVQVQYGWAIQENRGNRESIARIKSLKAFGDHLILGRIIEDKFSSYSRQREGTFNSSRDWSSDDLDVVPDRLSSATADSRHYPIQTSADIAHIRANQRPDALAANEVYKEYTAYAETARHRARHHGDDTLGQTDKRRPFGMQISETVRTGFDVDAVREERSLLLDNLRMHEEEEDGIPTQATTVEDVVEDDRLSVAGAIDTIQSLSSILEDLGFKDNVAVTRGANTQPHLSSFLPNRETPTPNALPFHNTHTQPYVEDAADDEDTVGKRATTIEHIIEAVTVSTGPALEGAEGTATVNPTSQTSTATPRPLPTAEVDPVATPIQVPTTTAQQDQFFVYKTDGVRRFQFDPSDLKKFGLAEGKCCKSNCFNEDGIEVVSKDCLTRVVMFVWKNNHGISDQALTDLFEIVSQKWFDSSHLPRSATTLKNMRDQLPLPIIMSEKVEVDTNKTDSETPPEVTQYTFNVRELIERQLNNPQIFEQSHFGAAIDNQNRIEAHHGDAWKGSITTSLDLYPMKTEEADPKLQSHKYPGGCYLVDCCDTDDNLREVLVRAIGLFRKSEEAYEDIIAYVQPIIRSVEDLQLFGLMKYADLFDFSKITRKHIPDSEIPGTRASDADLTDEEQEKASDITVSNCYLLKQSFRINANRFKEAVCVEIDRSSDDLDDVLPRLKIIRRGDRLPTKGDYDKGIVDEDGSVKRQRRSQASTRGGGTSRGKAGRLLKQKSRPTGANGRSANNIQKPMAPPNSQQCASHTCEGEENGEEFEDYASASPDQLQASMNEKLIHANTVTITPRNDGIPSHIIRQLIIPETDNTKFDRNLFLRGLPVPKQLSTTIKSNVTTKKKKKLERAAKKLKTLSAVQLNDFESRLGRKKTAIGRLRPTPNITMDRLIAAGHLRKTTAELEIESGEIVLDELSNDKSLPKLGVVIDLYSDKFGVFRTAHRTTGGIYMTILNLNHRGRDQCRNHTLCGFIPHGAKFSETGQTMMGQLKELAKGVIMNINGVQTKASQPAPVYPLLLSITQPHTCTTISLTMWCHRYIRI